MYTLSLVVLAAAVGCQAGREPGEPEWRRFAARPGHGQRIKQLERILQQQRVHGVVPLRGLLFQGLHYVRHGEPPFALPQQQQLQNIVPLLRFIRTELVPAIGPVRVVSGFRTRRYNRKAGGGSLSRHMRFRALDLEPIRASSRPQLHRSLRRLWRKRGKRYRLGLGLYSKTRFHLDVGRYRRWGRWGR